VRARYEKGIRKKGQPSLRCFDFDFDTPCLEVWRFATLTSPFNERGDIVHGGFDVSALVSMSLWECWAVAGALLRILLHGGCAGSQHRRLDLFVHSIYRTFLFAFTGRPLFLLGCEFGSRSCAGRA